MLSGSNRKVLIAAKIQIQSSEAAAAAAGVAITVS
jgi:hypothetical protein